MKKLLSAFAVLTAFAMIAASCSDDDTEDTPKIEVTAVNVTPAVGSVVAGETLELKAEVLPENATNKTIEWVSRTPEYATVNKVSGVVTGISEGAAEIWAVCGEKHGVAAITVTAAPIRVEKVELSKKELPLFVGKSEKLTVTLTPENATYPTATWESDKTAVASVSSDGVVTAVAEGTATITVTVDEKSTTCAVTVTTPAIENIKTPYLKDLTNSTVKMTASGFKAGDQVKLEAVSGEEYSAEVPVANVTAADATFELPSGIAKDRSYKLTIMRGTEALCIAYLRPDDQMVRLSYALGYYLTGPNEVVPDDSSMHENGDKTMTRRSYVPGKLFELDETSKEFMIWKADAKGLQLALPLDLTMDFTYATGVKSIDALGEVFDLSNVKRVYIANSEIESLDMRMFPEATILQAWGDGSGDMQWKKLKSVNFGTVGVDPVCKLDQIQLERQLLTGELDIRNCQCCTQLSVCDNAITSLNLGKANVDPILPIYKLDAERCQIREFTIENCGDLRQLWLAGNPMERLTLLNNSKQGYTEEFKAGHPQHHTKGQEYVYLFKAPASFSLSWASAADAKGKREFNVEYYWWRSFSTGNKNEKENTPGFPGGWVDNSPIVQALKDGVKITCWTYHGEDSEGDSHPIAGHTHEGGSQPCGIHPGGGNVEDIVPLN